jgi:hypothetical protein
MLLDLLFDVTMSGMTTAVADVRTITERFWRLSENPAPGQGGGAPTRVRFIWGRAWNFPAVIASLSERLEHFDESGAPRRSWLRMRLLRADDPVVEAAPFAPADPLLAQPETEESEEGEEAERYRLLSTVGAGPEVGGEDGAEPPPSNYLSNLADEVLGDARHWRVLASESDVDDPLRLPAGTVLRAPATRGAS